MFSDLFVLQNVQFCKCHILHFRGKKKQHIEQIAQFNSSELAHSQQITNAWTQAAGPFIVLSAEVM